jgi:uncharacterized membrane protein YedE/YeeE
VHLIQLLFTLTWAWWAAGLGLGLTAVAFAWVTGRKLGVSGLVESVYMARAPKSKIAPSPKALWFLLGLPLGGLIANAGHWNWTWTYGRMDSLSLGSFVLKVILLFVGGVMIGFGARWAGGCTSGYSLLGIARGYWMALLATLCFLVSGIVTAQILYKVF